MLALAILILAAILLLVLTFLRRRSPAVFRSIEAYERLNRAVGLAVENGKRLHISLGRGNLFTARVRARRWQGLPCCAGLPSAPP